MELPVHQNWSVFSLVSENISVDDDCSESRRSKILLHCSKHDIDMIPLDSSGQKVWSSIHYHRDSRMSFGPVDGALELNSMNGLVITILEVVGSWTESDLISTWKSHKLLVFSRSPSLMNSVKLSSLLCCILTPETSNEMSTSFLLSQVQRYCRKLLICTSVLP